MERPITVIQASRVTGVPVQTIRRWIGRDIPELTVWDGDEGQALVLASDVERVRELMATRQRQSRFQSTV